MRSIYTVIQYSCTCDSFDYSFLGVILGIILAIISIAICIHLHIKSQKNNDKSLKAFSNKITTEMRGFGIKN